MVRYPQNQLKRPVSIFAMTVFAVNKRHCLPGPRCNKYVVPRYLRARVLARTVSWVRVLFLLDTSRRYARLLVEIIQEQTRRSGYSEIQSSDENKPVIGTRSSSCSTFKMAAQKSPCFDAERNRRFQKVFRSDFEEFRAVGKLQAGSRKSTVFSGRSTFKGNRVGSKTH